VVKFTSQSLRMYVSLFLSILIRAFDIGVWQCKHLSRPEKEI
jgi:hypothetical protein